VNCKAHPDEKGIETSHFITYPIFISLHCKAHPDEKGIETHCECHNIHTEIYKIAKHIPTKRELKREPRGPLDLWLRMIAKHIPTKRELKLLFDEWHSRWKDAWIAKHIPTKRELKLVSIEITIIEIAVLQSTSRRKGN